VAGCNVRCIKCGYAGSLRVPETARAARDLHVCLRQVARHDPLVALRLIYQMFSELLGWIVLRTLEEAVDGGLETALRARGVPTVRPLRRDRLGGLLHQYVQARMT